MTIWEILKLNGIVRCKGKMICPLCHEKKVTASESHGVATCWGCNMHWTLNSEISNPAKDWATHLIARLSERCQNYLPQSIEAKDALMDRELPINDFEWLEEQELGAVPTELYFEDIKTTATQLRDESLELQQKQCAQLTATASKLGAKAKRAVQSKLDALEAKMLLDEQE